MNIEEIQAIFFQECEEGLNEMETAFAEIRPDSYDVETINTVFRAVHSIKGGAGAFGHERLQAFTHEYETLLDYLRNGTLSLDQSVLDTVLAAFDLLSDHVAAARDGQEAPADGPMLERLKQAADVNAAAAEAPAEPEPAQAEVAQEAPAADDDFDDLMAMLGGPASAPEEAASDEAPIEPITAELNDASTAERAGEADWRLSMRPAPNAFDNGGEPLLLLRELERLGAKLHAVDLSALPSLDAMDAECSYLGWQLNIPGALSEDEIVGVFDFTDGYGLELQRIGEISDDAAAPEADVASPPAAQDAPAPVAAPVAAPAPVQPVAAQPAPAMQAVPPAPVPAPTSAPAPSQAPAPAAAAAPSAAAAPAPAPAPSAPKVAASQTIRVDFDRLDRLVNLVGELVITQAMLTQRLSDYDLNGIGELSDLDHLTRELQESTMALRAQPMQTVFSRVPRIIRELEGETGKRVRLEIEGEMTEVDKTVVERIGEPLTHLIRNAVDHGLESPEKRVAAGKSAEGVVRLSAAHQSGRIVITVADDGAGINRDRVRQRAVERGIVAPDAALSNEEIDNLIFAPGFSTAETVSNISGRGVGMDVVRRNIQALGGRIGIQSNEGTGSSFSLSLPLTLAVLDGMIVKVGAQTFVIPLTHIVESLRPEERAVNGIGLDAALLDVRGQHVPLLRVARQLGIPDGETDPRSGVLIVVDGDHGPAALMVDSIQDQRQVVVKSLEANYRAIDGLAGATILGDGRVALILDIDTLTARRPGAVPMELAA